MMRVPIFFLILLVFIPTQSFAKKCGPGDLMLEFLNVQTFAPTDYYLARVSGTLEMPHTGYSYMLDVDKDSSNDVLRATLSLLVHESNLEHASVITPITIDSTIQIPHKSRELFIDVVKHFNWGAEYFQVKFTEQLKIPSSLCMMAEVYK